MLRIALAVVFLAVTPNPSQAAGSPPGAKEPKDVYGSLAYFHRGDGKGKCPVAPGNLKIGSGFFLQSQNALVLVTAAHVADCFLDGGAVTMRAADGNGKSFELEALAGHPPPFAWVFHEHADVAVLRLDVSRTPVDRQLALMPLDIEFYSATREPPTPGVQLAVVGFPLGLVSIQGPFSPIEKDTSVASALLAHPRFDTKQLTTFLIVQDPMAMGFSGAPVFSLAIGNVGGARFDIGGTFAGVGIVHGTIGDGTGEKFGAITPARFVRETIDKALKSPPANLPAAPVAQ